MEGLAESISACVYNVVLATASQNVERILLGTSSTEENLSLKCRYYYHK